MTKNPIAMKIDRCFTETIWIAIRVVVLNITVATANLCRINCEVNNGYRLLGDVPVGICQSCRAFECRDDDDCGRHYWYQQNSLSTTAAQQCTRLLTCIIDKWDVNLALDRLGGVFKLKSILAMNISACKKDWRIQTEENCAY